MSFFRRLFGNSPEDETVETVETTKMTHDENENVIEDKAPEDPLKTGELTLSDEVHGAVAEQNAAEDSDTEIDDEALLEALDQTIPVPEAFDETTIPEREPELDEASDLLSDEDEPSITRPLPEAEQLLQVSRGCITFGQASDQGVVRLNNQDSAFSFFFTSETVDEFPDFGIFVVADGMGGHQEGEKASAITARTMATEILNRIYMPFLNGADMNDPDQPTIVEAMVDAVQKANEAVREQVADGGTTLTSVVIRGEAAHIAHVGDSRAYWITEAGEIEKITRDHSVIARLKELGQLTDEEAEVHEQRNVLYRAIGQNDEVEVEIHRKRLIPNSYLLLCSDGLWNMVNDADILNIVENHPDPQEACNKLVALANAHGGTDNITVVIIKTPVN